MKLINLFFYLIKNDKNIIYNLAISWLAIVLCKYFNVKYELATVFFVFPTFSMLKIYSFNRHKAFFSFFAIKKETVFLSQLFYYYIVIAICQLLTYYYDAINFNILITLLTNTLLAGLLYAYTLNLKYKLIRFIIVCILLLIINFIAHITTYYFVAIILFIGITSLIIYLWKFR